MSFDVSSPDPSARTCPVVFLGGGGHAAVCVDVFRSSGREVLGYLAPKPSALELPHLGTDDALSAVLAPNVEVFVAIGSNRLRLQLVGQLFEMGTSVATCVSAHAVVSPSARLGRGTVVMPGVIINARTSLGDGVILNTSASVDHDGRVGDGAHIGPGCHLAGGVTVGEGALLGTGTIVIPDRTIGPWVTTGAGAVVVDDLLDAATYTGLPAKFHRA